MIFKKQDGFATTTFNGALEGEGHGREGRKKGRDRERRLEGGRKEDGCREIGRGRRMGKRKAERKTHVYVMLIHVYTYL